MSISISNSYNSEKAFQFQYKSDLQPRWFQTYPYWVHQLDNSPTISDIFYGTKNVRYFDKCELAGVVKESELKKNQVYHSE